MKIMCPKCHGLPFRYKLVPDNTFVGAHHVQTVCLFCDGTGEVDKDFVLDSFIDRHRFTLFKKDIMTPIRIQRKRTKGWKAPIGTVNCTRPGKYGNPFMVGKPIPVEYVDKLSKEDYFHFMKFEFGYIDNTNNAVYLFKTYVLPNLDVSQLRGSNLMCFCGLDQPCHVDEILKKANHVQ